MDQGRPAQTIATSLKRRFFSFPTLLSFAIAAAFILFLATRFDLDWSATWSNVRKMDPLLYLLAFSLYYLSFAFRGRRWQMLARNADDTSGDSLRVKIPSVFQCARFILIGWFVNSIAWLRLGDAYRAYAFAEESRGKFSWSLGTVLAERVLDMFIIFGVLIVSVVAYLLTTTRDSATSGYILLASSLMVLALIVILGLMKLYGARLARLLPGRFQTDYNRFQQGTLGSFKQLPILFALGLAGWLLEMTRLYFVVQALDMNISLPLVAIVALGHAMLSSVPTPGGVGAVEPGMTGLLLLGLERHDAASVALVDRSITYVSVIIVGGLVFLARQVAQARMHRRRALAPEEAKASPSP
jgi:uncharacterized protein (TIRG00374 family)